MRVALDIAVLVHHHFVSQLKFRGGIGGIEVLHWSFGQTVAVLLWLPVIAEFFYVA